ncbi:RNA polymerase sigma factor SigI [Anaerobacillus sp. MEB173]|uniref:RNA polymerase sigma factor SigI n=1 Tax=Anaerobacillus sp. MEB173 TaxID=3383345 RepID=UPI003F935E7B
MLQRLFKKRTEHQDLELLIEKIQAGDTSLHNELINQYKPFIRTTVSKVCKRYIDVAIDDEYSIGLIAFDEAIQKYSTEKGSSFLSFASLVIRRRVIDYIRYESRRKVNFSLDQTTEDGDNLDNLAEVAASVKSHKADVEDEYRREEILHFRDRLQEFKISFSELPEQSPKHKDARENMIQVAKTIIEHEEIKKQMLEKKKLPIKQLSEHVTVSRKTLERNRKYIIALTIVLLEDYLYIKEYLKEWLN